MKILALARDSQTVCTAVLTVTEYLKIFAGFHSYCFEVRTVRCGNILHLVLRNKRNDIKDRSTEFRRYSCNFRNMLIVDAGYEYAVDLNYDTLLGSKSDFL